MKQNPLAKRLAFSGLLAAVTLLLTLFVRIPLPAAGYLNLGDVGVFLCALALPLPYAPLAAGVGTALADLYEFPLYAPATLIVKAGMVLVFYALSRVLRREKLLPVALVAAVLVEAIGYFLYEWLLYGFATAIVGVPMNLLQAAVGAALAYVLWLLLKKQLPEL